VSEPEPTVTLAANVERMSGTDAITATAATIFERARPLPPKRDFTLELNGEFKDILGGFSLVLVFYSGRRIAKKRP
jgi:hypothetical protein